MTVFDSQNLLFKKPIGPVKLEKLENKTKEGRLYLKIQLERKRKVQKVWLVLDQMAKMEKKNLNVLMKKVTDESDSSVFEINVVFSKPATYEYYFKFLDETGEHYIRRKNGIFEGFITNQIEEMPWLLTVYKEIDSSKVMKSGIMYQIFPDRFRKGKTKSKLPENRWYRKWGEMPCYVNGEKNAISTDFFGGNFVGMKESVGYLQKLHVNVVYSNPICESSKNHRYAAIDYKKLDPVLGTPEEYNELIEAYHKASILYVIDGVLNHVGSDSIYFDRYNEHNSDGAFQSKNSKYRNWFFIDPNDSNNYSCWWGDKSLPKLNYDSDELKDYILGEDGVIRYWYRKWKVDGIRQDVADELPIGPREKIYEISDEERGGNKIIIPEVWEDLSQKWAYGVFMEYAQGKQATSVMNYPIKDTILPYVRYGGDYWASQFKKVCNEIFKENYPREIAYSVMNFLSTHDTVRAITKLAGPEVDNNSREWQAANNFLNKKDYLLGRARLMLAYVAIFFLPGIPSIYYGDEIGMQGMKDPFCRACFTWNHIDKKILRFFKRLCATRYGKSDFLAEAEFNILVCEGDFLVYERSLEDKKLRVFLNFSENEKDITKLFEEYEMEECSVRDIVEEPNIIFHIRTKQKDTVVRQDSNGNKRIVLSGYNGIVCFQ